MLALKALKVLISKKTIKEKLYQLKLRFVLENKTQKKSKYNNQNQKSERMTNNQKL